ncbi:MAG: DUF3450 domain-containing protein [Gammaproteobacteria bacterium]|nr:DUF3450 domain-containing protein [Gammaproteobacteria bacterium]
MNNRFLILGSAFALFMAASTGNATNELNNTMDAARANQEEGAASQKKIDALYEQKRIALQDMRITQTEIDQLNVYNRQLREIIVNQNNQIASLNKQIEDIEKTQEGIMPLMERMLNGLEAFVSLDIPFLLEEREQRIANLRSLLLASDVTVSEKFRRVLEAYQIEIEYGRTIEAYRGENDLAETVDYLRIGRNALLTVSLDGERARAWNAKQKKWDDLDSGYARSITKGVQIARKQSAPSLLELPLPTLVEMK